jgi:hypothetical protein
MESLSPTDKSFDIPSILLSAVYLCFGYRDTNKLLKGMIHGSIQKMPIIWEKKKFGRSPWLKNSLKFEGRWESLIV